MPATVFDGGGPVISQIAFERNPTTGRRIDRRTVDRAADRHLSRLLRVRRTDLRTDTGVALARRDVSMSSKTSPSRASRAPRKSAQFASGAGGLVRRYRERHRGEARPRPRNNVWIAGAGQKDAQVLKFTRDGKFLMQIGRSSKNQGSNDTENLGSPSGPFKSVVQNENKPSQYDPDAPPIPQFRVVQPAFPQPRRAPHRRPSKYANGCA
jgi:hypothetical protein